jgi:hypothetical protein
VTRFAPSAQASFAVTLDSASTSPVSVNYATANGTAVAGTDYTQTSGSLTFPAGVTSETVSVPITTVATGGPTKTFSLNLSGASGATISRGQATGSILNRRTKFFVVDTSAVRTFEYGSGGTSEEITSPLTTNGNTDSAPRGVATTAAGTTQWVVDANKTVYVYDNHGLLQGSWSAGSLSSSAALTGIATNGTDIWLVDSYADKVYRYTGAASRLMGSQNAASSFSLAGGKNGDPNPQDSVTDGTSFWVVDGTRLKVFKYTLSGSLLGSWSIDAANAHPTGITIDPNNVSDIWIVDNGTDKVYQYVGAASRTSGSQSAAATFALAAGNTNPQGIADPPPADVVRTAGAAPLPLSQPTVAALVPAVSGGQSVVVDIPSVAGRDAVFALPGRESMPKSGEAAVNHQAGAALTSWLDSSMPAANRAWTIAGVSGGQKPLDLWTPLTPEGSQGLSFAQSVVDLPDDPVGGEESPASAMAIDSGFAMLAEDAQAEE